MRAKGFLGPIGDDLPSLVPLLLALIIFFSTFTFTFTMFSKKSDAFAADLAALSVARVIKGSSYVTSQEHFNELCAALTAYNINYVAGLTAEFTTATTPSEVDIFDTDVFYKDPDTYDRYICQRLREDEEYSEEATADRTVLVRVYPVVLEMERVVYPMHLVVVVWQ